MFLDMKQSPVYNKPICTHGDRVVVDVEHRLAVTVSTPGQLFFHVCIHLFPLLQ